MIWRAGLRVNLESFFNWATEDLDLQAIETIPGDGFQWPDYSGVLAFGV